MMPYTIKVGDVMPVITISRQTASLGDEIAAGLSEKLGMQVITREMAISKWLPEVADSYELKMLEESPKFYLGTSKKGIGFKEFIEQRLKAEAENSSIIIIGMGAQLIFAKKPGTLNVRIIAPDDVRMQRINRQYGLSGSEAADMLEKSDRRHKRYISTLYGKDWADPLLYDLTLNTGISGVGESIKAISSLFESRDSVLAASPAEVMQEAAVKKEPVFKHPAEEEFADLLNMYNIEWDYEPKTFPLEWDAEGNVTMAFSPDFYLTRFDTYIELTTMEQKYVTTKNKKVRRLKELYPDINIKIVYKKDFISLAKRFGLAKEEN